MLELLVHVGLDHVHGHVTRAFDHHLHVVLPGDLGELTQGAQFTELGFIVGIGNGTGAQAIPETEGHVVGLHDLADVFEMSVEEALFMVRQAPLGHDRTAAGDNTGDPVGGHRHVAQQNAGVNGEVAHPLLGLLDQGVAEDFPGQVFSHAVDLLQCLVDRYGADGHRRVAQDPLAGFMDIVAGGQIHHRIAAPAGGPGHLGHFLLNGRGHRRITDVGIDLGEEVTADDHRLDFRVVDIHRNHRPSPGHFVTNKFRGNFRRDAGSEILPRMLIHGQSRFPVFTQPLVLADGDKFHFRGDDALAGIVHLGHVLA